MPYVPWDSQQQTPRRVSEQERERDRDRSRSSDIGSASSNVPRMSSSASGHRPAVNAEDVVMEQVGNKVGDRLPDKVRGEMRTRLQELRSSLLKHLRTLETLTRPDKEMEGLKEGRVPNNAKPFKVSYSNVELDQVMNPGGPSSFKIDIPLGRSFRQVKEALYTQYLSLDRSVDKKVSEKIKENLKDSISYSGFHETCKQMVPSSIDFAEFELGDLPPGLFPQLDVSTYS